MVRRESRPGTIGPITLGIKQTGAPSAGNLHAGCDVAGAGDGFTVRLLRHSQTETGSNKLGQTFGTPRQSSTRPASQLEWGSRRLPSRTGHHARFSSNPVTVSSGMWPVAVVAADDDTRPTTTSSSSSSFM